MTAVLSSNYNNTYLYFLPITAWCFDKLGIRTMCLMPFLDGADDNKKIDCVNDALRSINVKVKYVGFDAPKRKEETYTQISRNFAAADESIPDEETLLLGDIDMLLFRRDFIYIPKYDFFDVYGSDLTPKGQLPMCYTVAAAATWRKFFVKGRSFQQCLDDELAHEECQNMRANLWARDQEILAKGVGELFMGYPRTNGQTPFAQNRVDRTDLHYKDRLNHDVIDAHLWRDGYTDENHAKIMELLKYMHPQEDFTWLQNYRNAYIQLL